MAKHPGSRFQEWKKGLHSLAPDETSAGHFNKQTLHQALSSQRGDPPSFQNSLCSPTSPCPLPGHKMHLAVFSPRIPHVSSNTCALQRAEAMTSYGAHILDCKVKFSQAFHLSAIPELDIYTSSGVQARAPSHQQHRKLLFVGADRQQHF